MPEDVPSAAVFLMLGTCVLSSSALLYLFQKHVSGRPLVAYQPRRRVPWGPITAFVAIVMPMTNVAVFFVMSAGLDDVAQQAGVAQPVGEEVSSDSLLITGWGNFALMVFFVVGGIACLVSLFRADAHDLGLPTSWTQFRTDVGLGMLATIAAWLPIYVVQLTLVYAIQSETKHPLVEQLETHQTPAMLLLGFAMAVIAAPLFEEFTFRGLLQGWLERREDEVVGYTATARQQPPPEIASGEVVDSDEDFVYVKQSLAQALDDRDATETSNTAPPSQGWIPDLRHGWTPILISGVLFGLAHVGHGVAPVSLILFGIVLGYLYQRTHRLVPCLTAHMLFNAYSMVLLWLQLGSPAA